MLTLSKETRKKIVLDESRIWNMKIKWQKNQSGVDNNRLSFLIGYLYNEADMKKLLEFTHSYDFAGMSIQQKNIYLNRLLTEKHKNLQRRRNVSDFYSSIGSRPFNVLFHFLTIQC